MQNVRNTITKNEATKWPIPNYWDGVALCLVLGILVLFAWTAAQMSAPYQLGQPLPISLSASHLPAYALRTVLRMFIALLCSLVFTFVFGAWAAKSKHAERIIIPMIDILQSVPVLSFLYLTVAGFIALFHGSLIGPECAAIFAIFTSQVWNMTLSFYQSLKLLPKDLQEASHVFQLSPWQRFWRIEVPFSMPGLLWNTMMSMSGSWFFVTASEAISIANQHISLPGIGSYIAVAIQQANQPAIVYAIIAMLIVIAIYDQLLFRPLTAWIETFEGQGDEDYGGTSALVVLLFQRTRFLRQGGMLFAYFFDKFVNLPFLNRKPRNRVAELSETARRRFEILWRLVVGVLVLASLWILIAYILDTMTWPEIQHVGYLGAITAVRVMVLIVLASIIWVPVGVWIGLRPRVTTVVQPILQFLASFPANLLFPVAAYLILKYRLNINIWTSPLMVLGTQWYILFNVIAGASILPKELKQAAKTFKVTGWLLWRRLIIPGIFPFFVTGAITAAGGAWNASIIAEAVSWGIHQLHATGLGAYITEYSTSGSFPHVILGTAAMCIFVLIINRLLWRPLYNIAEERFRLG